VKLSIINLLKRRYIIEMFYGEFCHVCGEFNTKDHLVSFHFNHKDEDKKTLLASELFKNEKITCSEIVQVLEKENGGYLCNNCHTVFHESEYYDLLDKIYTNEDMVRKVYKDHLSVKHGFCVMKNNNHIRDVLKLPKRLSNNFIKYLELIDKMSKSKVKITNKSLAYNMGASTYKVPMEFFNRNSDFLRKFVFINKKGRVTTYKLTNEGLEAVSLMNYFRKYYKKIQL
jgi:hypothetical protein